MPLPSIGNLLRVVPSCILNESLRESCLLLDWLDEKTTPSHQALRSLRQIVFLEEEVGEVLDKGPVLLPAMQKWAVIRAMRQQFIWTCNVLPATPVHE